MWWNTHYTNGEAISHQFIMLLDPPGGPPNGKTGKAGPKLGQFSSEGGGFPCPNLKTLQKWYKRPTFPVFFLRLPYNLSHEMKQYPTDMNALFLEQTRVKCAPCFGSFANANAKQEGRQRRLLSKWNITFGSDVVYSSFHPHVFKKAILAKNPFLVSNWHTFQIRRVSPMSLELDNRQWKQKKREKKDILSPFKYGQRLQ